MRAHKRDAKISHPKIQETQLEDCGDVEEGREVQSRRHGTGSLIKVSGVCLKMHQQPYGIGASRSIFGQTSGSSIKASRATMPGFDPPSFFNFTTIHELCLTDPLTGRNALLQRPPVPLPCLAITVFRSDGREKSSPAQSGEPCEKGQVTRLHSTRNQRFRIS